MVLQIAKNCSGNGKSRVTKFDINMDTIKHHLSFYKLQLSWQDQKKKQNASNWKDYLCLQCKFNINYIGILNFSLKNLYFSLSASDKKLDWLAHTPGNQSITSVKERSLPLQLAFIAAVWFANALLFQKPRIIPVTFL